MRRILFSIAMISLPVLAWGQLAPPNPLGVSNGHVHLMARDTAAEKKFWLTLGGISGKFGDFEMIKYPGVLVLIKAGEPAGGSEGSIVHHVGFFVPNLKQAVADWNQKGLGVKFTPSGQQAFVVSPSGVDVEFLEDAEQTAPIVFHQVHFYIPPDALDEIRGWYAKVFGAEPGKRKIYDVSRLPGIQMTFTKSAEPTAATKGRALDHIGFEVKNLEAFCKQLEAKGVKLDMPYTVRPALGLALAFITDPWGTYIELTEGLDKL